MTRQMTERGYAKINLHLDITGRMADGYHRVETVMQTISLFDEVTVTLTDEPELCASCNVAGVPTDAKNIAVRAAKLFLTKICAQSGAHIAIRKQIPMAAGMAGGSADAAAALRALNRLYGMPLTAAELCELGAVLGADVPFCLVGGTAFADGRGDVLHALPSMPDCAVVCACEGEGVSTPWAYRLLDTKYDNFEEGCSYQPRGTQALRRALADGSPEAIAHSLYNIFEAPVLDARPVAAELRSLLLAGGAVGAMMSGSGPSVFGLFADDTTAQNAADLLRQNGYRPYLCRPVTP